MAGDEDRFSGETSSETQGQSVGTGRDERIMGEKDHFQKCHDTLCLPSKILHKHCFQFLLGLTMALRENKNNAYAKFSRANKEYYGIFESGPSGLA